MKRLPRKLRLLAGFLVPLAASGLAVAQEGAGRPTNLPTITPAAAEVSPQAPAPCTTCPSANPPQEVAEAHASPQVHWWAWLKYRLHACFLGFPEEFEAPPLGASVYAFGRAQAGNAEAAQMVLCRADFVEGSAALTPRGREQLAKIALHLSRNFYPLIIEPTLCAPELDQARVLEVMNALGHCGFAVPPQRVVIGPPPAVGLSGVEAGIIYNNLLNQTFSGGARAGGGGGGPIEGGGRPGGPGR